MKVLIADDHPLVLDAMARTVSRLAEDVQVLRATNLHEVQAQVRDHGPDLAVVDLNMPGMQGLAGLQSLRREHPCLPLIVASGQCDAATIRAVLALGVCGFIPKTESCDVVLQAIRLVQCGSVYVPAQTMTGNGNGHGAPCAGVELTSRQTDVLMQLLRGRPNKLIARELGLTEGTVKIHIAAILRALRVRNRTEAVLRARELGLAD